MCYLKKKNNLEFTHAVQHHNVMWTCISERKVIVSENSILQNFIENISNFCFQVWILSLVALLAFVFFSEMMNYIIGPVGCRFSPAVAKEWNFLIIGLWKLFASCWFGMKFTSLPIDFFIKELVYHLSLSSLISIIFWISCYFKSFIS